MPPRSQGVPPGLSTEDSRVRALNIAGLGLRAGHLTLEVEAALARCNHIYYLHSDPETIDRLSQLGVESLVDLSTFYETGTSRLDTYYRIAARAIFNASRNPPVGVALYGHPMVFSTLSCMLIAGSRRFGIDVEVYPGVSSIDGILATFGIDPGPVALQAHEATELLAFDRPLDCHSGLLVFQAGQLGTRIYTPQIAASDGYIQQLADRLATAYGRDHEITAMEVQRGGGGWTWRGTLSELPAATQSFTPNFTIYVPPAAQPPVRDQSILRDLDKAPDFNLL